MVSMQAGVDVSAVLAPLQMRVVRELLPSQRLYLVTDVLGRRDGDQLAKALQGRPGVRFAEADLLVPRERSSMPVPPNDPRYSGQWYLKKIGIEKAWGLSTGSPDVTVQVIDNGCDQQHPDLAAHVLPGKDVVDGDDDPQVEETGQGSNHGTACAGIIAAVGNNGIGIAGTCPECKVRCVRFLDKTVQVPISADVDAMRFALEHADVAVVSNSWAYSISMPVPQSLKAAIEDVSHNGHGGKGALVVFAAGNENRELQPGELYSLPEVVTVGAINNFDEAAPFSNRGKELDLTAPTGSLTLDPAGDAGDDPGDYTNLFGGTSAACPVVAGVAALLFSAKPDATADEVRAALVGSTRKAPFAQPDATGHDPLYGYGIVNPEAAIQKLLGITPDAGVSDGGPSGSGGGAAGGSGGGSAGTGGGTTEPEPSSCGCSSTPLGVLGLALAAMLRRRRR